MIAPVGALPDPKTLNEDQERGLRCALCNQRLRADRLLGTVTVTHGGLSEDVELWACAPDCETARRPRKRKQ